MKELNFSVVVFDTAPTGHTLRFLSMPSLFEKGMAKITHLKSQFGAIFEQARILRKTKIFYINHVIHSFSPRQNVFLYTDSYYQLWAWVEREAVSGLS